MIDTDDLDNMSRKDLVELLEAYNESLAEVERLRDLIEQVVDVWENCNHEDRTDWFNNFCEVMKND